VITAQTHTAVLGTVYQSMSSFTGNAADIKASEALLGLKSLQLGLNRERPLLITH
jgi:hypothetical protein